jgi:inosose dehydratase
MPFPFSTQMYGWGQDYARRGLDLADHYDEALADIAAAGFDSAENSLDRADPHSATAWADLLRAHGLRPISLYSGGAFHESASADTAIAQLAVCAPVMAAEGFSVLCVNPDPIGRAKTDAELATQARKLEALGAALQPFGIALGLHNHTPEMINGGREFHTNLRTTDPSLVGLFMDVHWCWRGGADPYAIYDEYADRIVGLHVRQSVDAIWTEALGDGDLDYRPMLTDLRSSNFTGPVVLEIAFEEATKITQSIADNNRQSLDYLRSLLG